MTTKGHENLRGNKKRRLSHMASFFSGITPQDKHTTLTSRTNNNPYKATMMHYTHTKGNIEQLNIYKGDMHLRLVTKHFNPKPYHIIIIMQNRIANHYSKS